MLLLLHSPQLLPRHRLLVDVVQRIELHLRNMRLLLILLGILAILGIVHVFP
jgi:hypothetical protein